VFILVEVCFKRCVHFGSSVLWKMCLFW